VSPRHTPSGGLPEGKDFEPLSGREEEGQDEEDEEVEDQGTLHPRPASRRRRVAAPEAGSESPATGSGLGLG